MDGWGLRIGELAELVGVSTSAWTALRAVRSLPSGQAPLGLVTPSALPIFAVVASCFAPAQILALLRAVEVLVGDRPAETVR